MTLIASAMPTVEDEAELAALEQRVRSFHMNALATNGFQGVTVDAQLREEFLVSTLFVGRMASASVYETGRWRLLSSLYESRSAALYREYLLATLAALRHEARMNRSLLPALQAMAEAIYQ